MYAISTKKRKYTTTPIVELIVLPDGKTEEKFIACVTLPKKEGDKLALAIVELLNQHLAIVNLMTN